MPKFVEGFVDRLQVPGAKDAQAFDDELAGFGVRKFASGKASYFVKSLRAAAAALDPRPGRERQPQGDAPGSLAISA